MESWILYAKDKANTFVPSVFILELSGLLQPPTGFHSVCRLGTGEVIKKSHNTRLKADVVYSYRCASQVSQTKYFFFLYFYYIGNKKMLVWRGLLLLCIVRVATKKDW